MKILLSYSSKDIWHLWHVLKIHFLYSIKLLKPHNKTVWYQADISNFQLLTSSSQKQLLQLRYYSLEACIVSENNLSQKIWDLVLIFLYFSSTTQQTCTLELEMKMNFCPTEIDIFCRI